MCSLRTAVALAAFVVAAPLSSSSASEQEWIRVSHDGKTFILTDSEKAFVPWGFQRKRDSIIAEPRRVDDGE